LNRAVQLLLLALTITAFVVFIRAYGPSGGCACHGSWRDAPGSTEYGPRTGVVWTDGLEGTTYHRLMCPRLGAGRVPRARRDLTGLTPCDLCEAAK